MNETLFFAHLLGMLFFSFFSLRFGKEMLMVLISLQAVLANFFVLKQIELFGWTVTCSDIFCVGLLINLNFLQEYFGKESAKKASWISFFSLFFFGVMSQLHLLYTPSSQDFSQNHYLFLLTPAPRILLASFASFFLVQKWDIWFFGFLKTKFIQWPWQLRNGISLMISQILDTFLFSFLGLYGLVASLKSIIVLSLLVKCILLLSMNFISSQAKRFVRNEI